MTHQIQVQFDKPLLTYLCTGILWYIGFFSTEYSFKKKELILGNLAPKPPGRKNILIDYTKKC
jgi:hypothetical protein